MIQHRINLVTLLPSDAIAAEVGVAEANFSNDLLDASFWIVEEPLIGIVDWESNHLPKHKEYFIKTLYSVDAWRKIENVTGDGNYDQYWHDKNYESAKEKLSKYGERSVILRGLSVEMANEVRDNTLDLLYLDGAHFKVGVASDLDTWYPKVKSGGIVAGHDYLNLDYGVYEAVGEFTSALGIEVFQIPENNINDASFYFIKP